MLDTILINELLHYALKFIANVSETTLVYRTRATILFQLASIESHLEPSNLEIALKDAKECIECLLNITKKNPIVADLQMVILIPNQSLAKHIYYVVHWKLMTMKQRLKLGS